MNIETILNAFLLASLDDRINYVAFTPRWNRRNRQVKAFRARILRMDADHRGWIYSLRIENEYLEKELAEKDEMIEVYRRAAEEFAPDDQKWFWTKEWQEGEMRAEKEIAAGNYKTFDSMEEFIASLEETDND
jgi:hypothetical protein